MITLIIWFDYFAVKFINKIWSPLVKSTVSSTNTILKIQPKNLLSISLKKGNLALAKATEN